MDEQVTTTETEAAEPDVLVAEHQRQMAKGGLLVTLDRISLVAMAASVAVMLQPWWAAGLKVGFFSTILCTVAQIVLSHLESPRRS